MNNLNSKKQSELTLLLREIAQSHTSFDLAKLPTVSAGPPTLAVEQFVASTSSAAPDDSGLDMKTVVQISATSAAAVISCYLVGYFWCRFGDGTIRRSMVRISGKDGRKDQWRNVKSLKRDTLGDKNIKQVSPEPEPESETQDDTEDLANSEDLRSSAEAKDSEKNGAVIPKLNLQDPSSPKLNLQEPSSPLRPALNLQEPSSLLRPKMVPAAPEGIPPSMAVYDLPIKVRSATGDSYVNTKVVMSGRPRSAPACGASRKSVSFNNGNRPYSAVGVKRSVKRGA